MGKMSVTQTLMTWKKLLKIFRKIFINFEKVCAVTQLRKTSKEIKKLAWTTTHTILQ